MQPSYWRTFVVEHFAQRSPPPTQPWEWTAAKCFRTHVLFYTQGGSAPLLLSHFAPVRVTTRRVPRWEEREVRPARRQEARRNSDSRHGGEKEDYSHPSHLFVLNHVLKTRKEQSDEKINEKERRRKNKNPAIPLLSSSAPSYHPESTSTAALEPLKRTCRCFFLNLASAHQHRDPITCKLMPLFRGKDSSGFRKTSKRRAQRPPASPPPSQPRRGGGCVYHECVHSEAPGPFISFFIEVDVSMEHKGKDPEAK